MNTVKDREELVDEVIEEMKLQIADNDWTVIEGLLTFVPTERLRRFLPEEDEALAKEQDDEVRILMNVHCLLCLATFPENSTAPTVDTCPNCGNADKKQIIHLQENDQ